MTIKRYNEKRHFDETPEPAGKTVDSAGKRPLRFVIQKHAASHLHYDFRLELNGVLLSWAVPKGPSLNPEDKRLAMHVEDHPIDYRSFEGTIPDGNYGAGTVMVWDEGTYCADPALSKADNVKQLNDGYKKGKLTFMLDGQKLQGEFSLVKMRGNDKYGDKDNAWLLVKADDANAVRDGDVREDDKSATTGRTLQEIAAGKKENAKVKAKARAPAKKRAAKDSNATKPAKATKKVKASDSDELLHEAHEPHAAKKSTPAKALKSVDKERHSQTSAKKINFAEAALALGGKLARMPHVSGPQLATLVDEPFDKEDWLYEIKWDGYRALSYYPPQRTGSIISRNGLSFDRKFADIRTALDCLPCEAVIDGEIVVLDKEGRSSFSRLQQHEQDPADLTYYVFDLLYVDGVDIRDVPLLGRKQLLKQLVPNCYPKLQYSDHVVGHGLDFFEAARKSHLEGIIAKDGTAPYQTRRTRHWLKIKVEQRQEFLIAGYTAPRRSRSDIGSLVLAYYERVNGKSTGRLRFAGHVGTGMDTELRADLKEKLDKLERKTSPFDEPPATNERATWVKPELICEVRFTEKTPDCQLRHPVFVAMREDKKPNEIFWEVAEQVATKARDREAARQGGRKKAAAKSKTPASRTAKPMAPVVPQKKVTPTKKSAAAKEPPAATNKPVADKKSAAGKQPAASGSAPPKHKAMANATTAQEPHTFSREAPARVGTVLKIDKWEVPVSHPERIYFPQLKLTKLDVINYYRSVASVLLPYLKDRPFMLHRFPQGVGSDGFYQKDNPQELPEWVKTTTIHSESTGEDNRYVLCQNEATLVYLANLGCLEMHTWHSRLRKLDKPDWMIFDLDPVDIGFGKVVEVAQAFHAIFEASKLPHYCKTSGKRGLHIAVPLGGKYDNDTVRDMALTIAELVHHELPAITSLERSPSKRLNRIYLDYLQNGHGKTLAAPYSLRAVDYAGVSTPLRWNEVTPKLDPRQFTVQTIIDRIRRVGDLWQGMLTEAIDLKKLVSQHDGSKE
ncbi:MAG: non-homologous end-joining DNA ligase [Pseudomonadota bacterium]